MVDFAMPRRVCWIDVGLLKDEKAFFGVSLSSQRPTLTCTFGPAEFASGQHGQSPATGNALVLFGTPCDVWKMCRQSPLAPRRANRTRHSSRSTTSLRPKHWTSCSSLRDSTSRSVIHTPTGICKIISRRVCAGAERDVNEFSSRNS